MWSTMPLADPLAKGSGFMRTLALPVGSRPPKVLHTHALGPLPDTRVHGQYSTSRAATTGVISRDTGVIPPAADRTRSFGPQATREWRGRSSDDLSRCPAPSQASRPTAGMCRQGSGRPGWHEGGSRPKPTPRRLVRPLLPLPGACCLRAPGAQSGPGRVVRACLPW